MGEVGADPIELARPAATFLRASQRVGDALSGTQTQATPPATMYGDTRAAERLHAANDLAAEQAGLAVGWSRCLKATWTGSTGSCSSRQMCGSQG